MKKSLLTIAMALIGFAGFSQTNVGNHQVTISIAEAADIDFSSAEDITFSYADAAAITADAAEQQSNTFDMSANYDWNLNAYAEDNFQNGDETAQIPISVLTVNSTAIGIGSANAVIIGSNDAGEYEDETITYDVALGTNKWTYAADTYSTTVYFTLTKQ